MKNHCYRSYFGGSLMFSMILTAVLACSCVTQAQTPTKSDLNISLVAKKVIVQADGKETFASAEKAQPGDMIQYTAVYSNEGKGAIRNLEPQLPIPEGMEYIPNTAKPKAAKASLDSKTFQPIPIKRKIKSNGTTVEMDVPEREFRALRWIVNSLADGTQTTVAIRVKVVGASVMKR